MTFTNHVHFDDLAMAEDGSIVWQDRPFTGVAYDTFPAGNPWSEATFVEGLKEGLTRVWYPNGGLKEEARYWKGVRHGQTRQWDESARIVARKVYEFGILVREISWDENQTIVDDWRISPDDNLFDLLESSRKKYKNIAPLIEG